MSEKKSNNTKKRDSGDMKVWAYVFIALASIMLVAGMILIFTSPSPSQNGGSQSLFGSSGCVGVIRVDGPITAEDVEDSIWSAGVSGSPTIVDYIRQAQDREDIKSILLVVNSPGGSPVASREIYNALKESDKPKVAYFREVAASGGYYIAMGTDYIISEPDAITGSIGARMTLSEMTGLFEKIGYNETSIKSGELKDMGTPARPMTEKERMILQEMVDQIFSEFKDIVIQNRGSELDRAEFEKVLDARIMSGRQAHEIGMVDEVGSKDDAIDKAIELTGEDDLDLCFIEPEKKTFFEQIMESSIPHIFPKTQVARYRVEY